MSSAHHTYVSSSSSGYGNYSYTYVCTCGQKGGSYNNEPAARKAASKHEGRGR
jgi:hypothetical protein